MCIRCPCRWRSSRALACIEPPCVLVTLRLYSCEGLWLIMQSRWQHWPVIISIVSPLYTTAIGESLAVRRLDTQPGANAYTHSGKPPHSLLNNILQSLSPTIFGRASDTSALANHVPSSRKLHRILGCLQHAKVSHTNFLARVADFRSALLGVIWRSLCTAFRCTTVRISCAGHTTNTVPILRLSSSHR